MSDKVVSDQESEGDLEKAVLLFPTEMAHTVYVTEILQRNDLHVFYVPLSL